jgi:hypothetical protein
MFSSKISSYAAPQRKPAKMRRPTVAKVAAAAIMALLAGCAYRGGIDNPFTSKVAWFSYLDGADIRTACQAGAIDRYRLVYNARYEEQLRSYEITGDGAGGGYLVARAIGPTSLIRANSSGVIEFWNWRKSQKNLTPAEMAVFREKLRASGMYDGAPVGLRLFSGNFYWVAAACEDDQFHYSAWLHPSARFAAISFPAFLFSHDETGLAVRQPRFVSPAERIGAAGRREEQTGIRFWLQVDEQGLGGQ